MSAQQDTPPDAPVDLQASGLELWSSIATPWTLDPAELDVLARACTLADVAAALSLSIDETGVVVLGSKGQPVVAGAVGELRQTQLAIGRLVGSLKLPALDEASLSVTESMVTLRARKAARSRWNQQRAREKSA